MLVDQGHTASGEFEQVSPPGMVFKYYAFLSRLEKKRKTKEEEEGWGEKEQVQGFCHVGGEGCRKVRGREGEQIVCMCMRVWHPG